MRGTSHRGGPSHLFWHGGVTKGPWPGRCRACSAALLGPGCPGVPQPSLDTNPPAAFSSSHKTPVKAKAPIPRAVWYNYLCGGGRNRCTSADESPNSADLLRALIRVPVPFPGDSDPQPCRSVSVAHGHRGAWQSWSQRREHEGSEAAGCWGKASPAPSGSPSAASEAATAPAVPEGLPGLPQPLHSSKVGLAWGAGQKPARRGRLAGQRPQIGN